jgi:PAS domain S-box-containing protein
MQLGVSMMDGDSRLINSPGDEETQKLAEERLARQNAYLEAILQTTADGFWVVNHKGYLQSVNQAYCRMSGYTKEELEVMRVNDLDAIENPELTARRIQRIMENGSEIFETKHHRKDGSILDVEVSVTYLDQDGGQLICFCRDITDRKQAELALREKDRQLEMVSDNFPLGVIYQLVSMPDGGRKFTYISKGVNMLHGLSEQSVYNDASVMYNQMLPDDLLRLKKLEAEAVEKMSVFRSEYRIRKPDGEIRWFMAGSAPRPQPDGSIIWDGIEVDITEQKQLEEKLKESESKLRSFLAYHPGIVFLTDRNGVFLISEGEGLARLGLKPGEVVGLSVYDIYKDYPHICESIGACIEQGIPQNYSVDVNGIVYESWLQPVKNNDGAVYGVVGISTDITERKRAEEAVLKSLEEKKVLLAEIHHRVKNNLAIISSLLSLQSEFSTDSDNPDTLLKELRGRVLSMASVHELVYQSSNFAEISTEKLVLRISDYLRSIYQTDGLHVGISIQSDVIMLDMNRCVPFSLFLNEAITNIWKHAFAGRQVGSINIRILRREKGFLVTIEDDGCGVQDLDKLRNPDSFGYTIIHGLVGQLNGTISFMSNPGGGLHLNAEFPQ